MRQCSETSSSSQQHRGFPRQTKKPLSRQEDSINNSLQILPGGREIWPLEWTAWLNWRGLAIGPVRKMSKGKSKSHFGSKSQTLHSCTEKWNSDFPHYLRTNLYFIGPEEEKEGESFTELSRSKSASFNYWQTWVLATTVFFSRPPDPPQKNRRAEKIRENP